jgi:hypothetical protein
VLTRVNGVVPHSKKWTIREIGLVISRRSSGKIIMTTVLMTFTDAIAYSVVVVGCGYRCCVVAVLAATIAAAAITSTLQQHDCLALYYRASTPCNGCLAVLLQFLRSMIVLSDNVSK